MKVKIFILSLISFLSSLIAFGGNEQEAVFIELLKEILELKIFCVDDLKTIYKNDTCIFYSNSCACKIFNDCEKHIESSYLDYKLHIWPSDYVFINDVKKWIKIYDCEMSEEKVILNLEIFFNYQIQKRGQIVFNKNDNSWKLGKHKLRIVTK
ncbi:MAG: hypothetical protein R2764_23070 [Bacteroidales bacterium]